MPHPGSRCFITLIPDRTLAKPLKDFAPLYKDNPSDPKIVDFLVTLKLPPVVANQVRHLLRAVPEEELRTINQTSHTRYEPAILSIETKRGHNDEEDAKFKLAMWTAAWQNQIDRFTKGAACTPLPGVIVFGHIWNLYWLVDLGTSVVSGEPPIMRLYLTLNKGCY